MKYKDFLGLELLPEKPHFPVILEAVYELSDDEQSAMLHLTGHHAQNTAITVIHDSHTDITEIQLIRHEGAETLRIRDDEAIIALARRGGVIVACGLYQVNLGGYESIGSVLIPIATSNMEMMQSDAQMVARILQTALAGLDDLEPTQKVEVVR